VGLSLVAFTLAASIFAMFLYITLYIQDNLGFSPFQAGLRFLPLTLVSFSVAFFAGRLTVRVKYRFLLFVGMILVTGGLLFMGTTSPDSAWTVLLPGFILCGFGIGTVNPVLASGAVSVVEPQHSGMASGANNTFRQVGLATGIAVLGAVFQSQIVAHTTAALLKSPYGEDVLRRGGAQLNGAMASGGVREAAAAIPVPGARQALLNAYQIGFSTTLNHLMYIGAAVAFVGVVSAIALVRQRDFIVPGTGTPRPSAEAPAGEAVPAAHA
jgi:MFS family permease